MPDITLSPDCFAAATPLDATRYYAAAFFFFRFFRLRLMLFFHAMLSPLLFLRCRFRC